MEHHYGRDVRVRGLTVEDIVERLTEQLMPLLDRSNRMMLRNLKAWLKREGRLAPRREFLREMNARFTFPGSDAGLMAVVYDGVSPRLPSQRP